MQKIDTSSPEQNNKTTQLEFQGVNGKKVTVCFDEIVLSSEAGLLTLAQMDESKSLIDKLAYSISEQRNRPIG